MSGDLIGSFVACSSCPQIWLARWCWLCNRNWTICCFRTFLVCSDRTFRLFYPGGKFLQTVNNWLQKSFMDGNSFFSSIAKVEKWLNMCSVFVLESKMGGRLTGSHTACLRYVIEHGTLSCVQYVDRIPHGVFTLCNWTRNSELCSVCWLDPTQCVYTV